MSHILKTAAFLAAAGIMAFSGCSSDPEGPVSAAFLEEGSYSPGSGETAGHINAMRSVSVVPVPTGIGSSSFLRIGEIAGIRFESILIRFDFDSLGEYTGMNVDSAMVVFPLEVSTDRLLIKATFNELLEDFSEDDTLLALPLFDPDPIPAEDGDPVREMNFENNSFSIGTLLAQSWIDGTGSPWEHGICINRYEEPETLGIIEMRSQNYGSDPPVLKMFFDDGSTAVFPAEADYSITSYSGTGIECVGGAATRVYFEFDLEGIPERAMVHYSALVLHLDGSRGLGATPTELTYGFSTDFIYYLYTPAVTDPSDEGFLGGTGVATNSFVPTISGELRIPLAGFTADVLTGKRVNTGLVFQSDLENVRYQRAVFYDTSAPDSLRPYIEVLYTMPADFSGVSE